MPQHRSPSYTSDHELHSDGSVVFACSGDTDAWPWLALPPQHPIVIQTQNYWASVGASAALGTLEEGKWSALTWTDWALGDIRAGIAAHGQFSRAMVEDKLAFETILFDSNDRRIVTLRGRGVVFRHRNFESWRQESKGEAAKRQPPPHFDYAPARLLNLSPGECALVSSFSGGTAKALITKENGLMPGHPYFSGSGDHVNAPHLAELARQVASLLIDGAPFLVTSGEMDMHRYVELDCPIDLLLVEHGDNSLVVEVSQLEHRCARLALKFQRVDIT